MPESASDDLQKSLSDNGYTVDGNAAYRVTASGVDKVYIDGGRVCKPDSNDWTKPKDGDTY